MELTGRNSPALEAAFKASGCNVCHVKGAESKKEKNAYGAELDKLMPGDIKERLKTEKEAVLKELDAAKIAGPGLGEASERAAWTVLARVLLNLDEAVTKG